MTRRPAIPGFLRGGRIRSGSGGWTVSRPARRPGLAGFVLCALVAASCGQTPRPSSQDTGQPTTGPTATTSETGPDATAGPTGAPVAGADLRTFLLDEVVFAPVPGSAAFVDLVNTGQEPVELAGLSLLFGGIGLPLERAGPSLGPGQRLTVRFDGENRADGAVFHAPAYVALPPDSGSVELVDGFGTILDEVAWGTAAGAVATSPGGIARDPEPGASIGRAPGTASARDRLAWVLYPPDQVTSGGPNAPVEVGGLHPMSGAVLPVREAKLSWFPVPGATSYRVQIAADESFTSPIFDATGPGTSVDVSGLAPGTYLWHVQSVNAEGGEADFSEPSMVDLAAEGTGIVFAVSTTPVKLAVPLIEQHKDTKMLLLESQRPDGPHAWDVDHGHLDQTDPADNTNCVLASLAMMNHFAGGDLTQDRIGFESHKNDQPGPGYDLNYGSLFDVDEITSLYAFALGVTPTYEAPNRLGSVDPLWGHVVSSIDRGIPVLAGTPDHVFVITGYAIRDDHRLVALNDPWHGRYEVDIDSFDPTSAGRSPAVTWDYWRADRIRPVHGENITQDSDGDGVVDFDETERFHTDPNLVDSDLDGVHDKEDIYASVFDGDHGYAYVRGNRDYDHDGLPMERDPDSDSGGCDDGLEDKNGNGLWESWLNESWNFDAKDDACKGLAGTITFTYAASGSLSGVTDITRSGSMTLAVRVKPDPTDPGAFLDDGSIFTMRQALETRVPIESCTQDARQWVSAGGTFTGDYGSLGAHIFDDEIVLSAEQSVPAYGYAETCIPVPGMSLVMAPPDTTESLVFASECVGKEQAAQGTGRTFVFDCTQSPYPPVAAGDYGFTTWIVHGSLTVP